MSMGPFARPAFGAANRNPPDAKGIWQAVTLAQGPEGPRGFHPWGHPADSLAVLPTAQGAIGLFIPCERIIR